MESEKKLYKSNKNKMIDGVCGGIGEYFGIDPTLVRLAAVVLCVFGGGGLIAYIAALIIIPRAPEGYDPAAREAASAKEAPKTEPAKTPDGTTDGDNGGGSPTMI